MSVLSCPTVLREASLEKQEKMAITNFDGAPCLNKFNQKLYFYEYWSVFLFQSEKCRCRQFRHQYLFPLKSPKNGPRLQKQTLNQYFNKGTVCVDNFFCELRFKVKTTVCVEPFLDSKFVVGLNNLKPRLW